jgi:hypothetical protein
MEFASAITGFIELCSWAQSRWQERAPIQIQLYVAGRRVKVVPRYALGFHLDPPPGSGGFAFRIWRVEYCLRQEWPSAPDALKVMCAKNFSTPAKFGIMPEVSEISSGLL